jgi:P2-related tail formation protein
MICAVLRCTLGVFFRIRVLVIASELFNTHDSKDISVVKRHVTQEKRRPSSLIFSMTSASRHAAVGLLILSGGALCYAYRFKSKRIIHYRHHRLRSHTR